MSDKSLILVVEDNDFVRMQVVNYLRAEGYGVLEASEGGGALDSVISNTDIDLAVVDVRMEPMGGFDFIKAMQSRDIAVPVILVTGDRTPDLLEQATQWGVRAVLMKPVEKERLIKTVSRIIEIDKRRS